MNEFSRDEIIEFRRAGKTWSEISKELDIGRDALRKFVKRLDPPLPDDVMNPRPPREKQIGRDEILQMVDEGLTDAEIGERLGIKPGSAMRLRQRRGVWKGTPGLTIRPRTPEELSRASQLLNEGYSYQGVSEITGIGVRALIRHFPGRGFTKKQAIEASAMARKLNRIIA